MTAMAVLTPPRPLCPPLEPWPGEAADHFEGVYIQQAPFVKNAIFGFEFEVLLGYSHRCNLVIWNLLALPNKMSKTACRNSAWFAFYGPLKSADLKPESVSFFFLSFFKTLQFPSFISYSI